MSLHSKTGGASVPASRGAFFGQTFGPGAQSRIYEVGKAESFAVLCFVGYEVYRMKKQAYCLASLILVVVALCLHFGAKDQASKGVSLRAHTVTVSAEDKQQMEAAGTRFVGTGAIFGLLGLCMAVASLFCLFVSFRRHEPEWRRSVPVALLAVYVLLEFTLV